MTLGVVLRGPQRILVAADGRISGDTPPAVYGDAYAKIRPLGRSLMVESWTEHGRLAVAAAERAAAGLAEDAVAEDVAFAVGDAAKADAKRRRDCHVAAQLLVAGFDRQRRPVVYRLTTPKFAPCPTETTPLSICGDQVAGPIAAYLLNKHAPAHDADVPLQDLLRLAAYVIREVGTTSLTVGGRIAAWGIEAGAKPQQIPALTVERAAEAADRRGKGERGWHDNGNASRRHVP